MQRVRGGLCIKIESGHVHGDLGGRQPVNFWAETVSRCGQLPRRAIGSETMCAIYIGKGRVRWYQEEEKRWWTSTATGTLLWRC
jgi:hypothetical protein